MKRYIKPEKNQILPMAVVCITLLALILYAVFFLNHLMHSDMAAEVILSKLLRDRGELVTREWYYSTEIRILYSQLVMTPLFYLFRDFHTVKLLSVLIYLILLLLAYFFFTGRTALLSGGKWIALALLLAPWSNEYLDMMFLGDFYTSQTICMLVFLGLFFQKYKKSDRAEKAAMGFLTVFSLLMGLSGLRYPACLFIPLLLGLSTEIVTKSGESRVLLGRLVSALVLTAFAGAGFVIHKLYFAKYYSFDKTPVSFVAPGEVPGRVLEAFRLMLEFFGYREGVGFASGLGLVNVLKCGFFLAFLGLLAGAFGKRNELFDERERTFLWYFLFLFLINLYMLIFTNVLLQYRYWIPVFVMGIFPAVMYLERAGFQNRLQKPLLTAFLCLAAFSSLYGELWQDVKFDDCAKREGYMAFLEKSDYDFGYATFWNGPVTEYLANGRIHVGNIGPEDKPYEWLTPKAYYQKGFHKGKVFVLLAGTEEKGLLESDAPIMRETRKVYGDEFYSIYEKSGMFLFSEEENG